MMAVATKATNAPIHAHLGPIIVMNALTGPLLVFRPRPNSTRMRGMDQANRNTTHATRNDPPPLVAATRGKRQMFPVPTAMPSMASIIPRRDPNSGRAMIS